MLSYLLPWLSWSVVLSPISSTLHLYQLFHHLLFLRHSSISFFSRLDFCKSKPNSSANDLHPCQHTQF